jgi:hypothetical protein
MKVNLKSDFLPRGACDSRGILDITADGIAIISTGIPDTIPDDNPWEYTAGNMMEDEMFDMFADIARGAYVSPNRGAEFANYECCDIIQSSQGIKSITGAMNNLMVDVQDENTVFVDPSAGIVNALKNVSVDKFQVVYTHPEFPLTQVQKTFSYAESDSIVMKQPLDLIRTNRTLVGDVVTNRGKRLPFYSIDLSDKREREKWNDYNLYLGSLGHWCASYQYARGYEFNPYHPLAYKYMDDVVQEKQDYITYRLFSGAPGLRHYKLFPDYYRYQTQQISTVYKKTKLRAQDLDVVLVSSAYPIYNLPRAPNPVVNFLTDDVRFIVAPVSLQQEDQGVDIVHDMVIYDTVGTDTYFSRYGRMKKKTRYKIVELHRTYEEALKVKQEKDKVYFVTSRHTDPQEVKQGQGTHYLYSLGEKIEGTWNKRFGDGYSIVSSQSSITTSSGTHYGHKCVALVEGTEYTYRRSATKAYEFLTLTAEDKWLCPEQFLTLTENDRKTHDLYDLMPECSSCRVNFTDLAGNVRTFCSQNHTMNAVYSLDSLYYHVAFDVFKKIKFGDDIGDYFDTEIKINPLAYE